MTPRQTSHGFHLDMTGDLISVALFVAALIVIPMIGAGLCALVPWR